LGYGAELMSCISCVDAVLLNSLTFHALRALTLWCLWVPLICPWACACFLQSCHGSVFVRGCDWHRDG
jgi:hypothetical protein